MNPAGGLSRDLAAALADLCLLQTMRLLESLVDDELSDGGDGVTSVLGAVGDSRNGIRNITDEDVFVAAFEHLYNAVVITDADFDGGPCVRRCNPAFCTMTGYSEEELLGQSLRILQGPETDRAVIDRLSRNIRAGEFFEGSTTNYRKNGVPYIVRWNISPVRDPEGAIVAYVSIQQDITALSEANERNRILGQEVRWHADRLASELKDAARYTASILPHGLTGKVRVSSRCLPAHELGGDSLDYLWLDDDHLVVYLIDVSGHGLKPALLSVSVHNMLRSRSMSTETLLQPAAVLAELNRRFQMEQHDEHYFTMWYGVYHSPSRTLRYASAGAPPALVFAPATGADIAVTELPATSLPIGMFADTEFAFRAHTMPPRSQLLVYSDGACEIAMPGDRQLRWGEFVELAERVAASPSWTPDELIGELNGLTRSGTFEDDFSLIQLTFV